MCLHVSRPALYFSSFRTNRPYAHNPSPNTTWRWRNNSATCSMWKLDQSGSRWLDVTSEWRSGDHCRPSGSSTPSSRAVAFDHESRRLFSPAGLGTLRHSGAIIAEAGDNGTNFVWRDSDLKCEALLLEVADRSYNHLRPVLRGANPLRIPFRNVVHPA